MQLKLNPALKFQVPEGVEYQVISIVKEKVDGQDEIFTPDQITQFSALAPQIDPTKGVILEGAAAIWMYVALSHLFHATPWVATNDPRLGAVVAMSHSEAVKLGQVFPKLESK